MTDIRISKGNYCKNCNAIAHPVGGRKFLLADRAIQQAEANPEGKWEANYIKMGNGEITDETVIAETILAILNNKELAKDIFYCRQCKTPLDLEWKIDNES